MLDDPSEPRDSANPRLIPALLASCSKGESKNDRVKVHSDGPSLVLSWSIFQLVNYHVRCVSFRLFIWYLRYGIVGTFGTAVIKFAVLMEPLRESRAPLYMVRMRHSATR